MRRQRCVVLMLTLILTASAAVDAIDTTVPLECAVEQAHDCLPSQSECLRLHTETGQAPVFGIDFARQEIRSPFRTAVLRVSRTTVNKESIILQGTDLLFAFSVLINKDTGALTVSIGDRKGAYIAFGLCKAPSRD